jgi:diguanylate cyclase (GGDEF)-like protein
MDKRFTWIFLGVTAAFFVFVVGFTGFRIESARRTNVASAQARVPALQDHAAQLRDETGGFESTQFKDDMRTAFDAEPRLLLLAFHSPDDGILYLVSRARGLLRDPEAVTPDWRGTPSYRTTAGFQVLLSTTMDGETGTVTMDAVYSIMDHDDLYPVVRDDLFLFLTYLLACGVTLLIMMGVLEDKGQGQGQRAGSAASPYAASPAPYAASPAPAAPAPATAPEPAPETPATPDHGLSPFAEAVGRSRQPAEQPLEQPFARRSEFAPEPPIAAARGLSSPHTGLAWADHLSERLAAEIARAGAADQDLACARVRIDEPFADAKLPLVHAEIARLLKASFPVQDLLFEHGNDGYTIVLPDADVDTAVRALEQFRTKTASSIVEARARTLSVGVSSRGGRLVDAATLLEEADTALAKASREGGNQVIGFRADPSRFRSALSGSPA